MRIMLVDDEPALRELLRATFEGADVTVVAYLKTVDEALAAADLLEAEGVSLEVLDPLLDGHGGETLSANGGRGGRGSASAGKMPGAVACLKDDPALLTFLRSL